MRNLKILFIVLLIISCRNKTYNSNVNEIISFIVDKYAFPLIPPPPINDTNIEINKRVIDSLSKVKLVVALYPTLNDFTDNQIKNIPDRYLNIIKMENTSDKRIKLNELFSRKGHKIILADTIQIKTSKDFQDFDLLFWFSKFYFSEDNNTVLFELGISRSRLAGSSSIYVLKKEANQWHVDYSKPLSEW